MIEISDILEVKKHLSGLKAVVFDLDDTLYSEKEYVRSGYRKIEEILPEVTDTYEKLWRLFEAGKPAIDELLKMEKLESESLKKRCLDVYRNQIPDIHLYNGVAEMLHELRNNGMKLGIITDGRPEGQRAKLHVLQLESMVDAVIVTDELGGSKFRKPNPTAFELMREKLGVAYEEMCYVGDNVGKDFTAPQQLGMRAIHFLNKDGLYT